MNVETYHHENLREELIENGLKLLDTEGYDGFSLRKVAKVCGVSHTAPYRHFKDKEELIAAIAAKVLHQFNASLKTAIAQYPGDVRGQVKEMGCAYVRFFVENPAYLRLLFFSDISRWIDGKLANGAETLEKPEMTFYEVINRYAAEDSAIDPGDALERKALTLGAWGLVHGITVLLVQGDFPYEGDYMEVVRKIIWKGMGLG
ncbi:TetR/AcrR family transcriptional regulator [Desulfosporosinus sp. PR]|uniref:TetR/AcrR family transcriptional regulator n=1 Tax=Candidatus Desulfosporosinus nitrosoreducens TaxID=3401928 RepID=UPI0027F6AB8D|nr:TetR/AcrR family transcriptional regulator [Desulfosporosinus sp. PR]MDQ7092591.1 TetR/AcrR family transcriptional regulator [Desulfosporosinus sp. PR]